MILEFKLNALFAKSFLCGIEIGSIHAESRMMNREFSRQRYSGMIGWEGRDGCVTDSNNAWKDSPRLFHLVGAFPDIQSLLFKAQISGNDSIHHAFWQEHLNNTTKGTTWDHSIADAWRWSG